MLDSRNLKKRTKKSIPRNNIYVSQSCSGKAARFCLARIWTDRRVTSDGKKWVIWNIANVFCNKRRIIVMIPFFTIVNKCQSESFLLQLYLCCVVIIKVILYIDIHKIFSVFTPWTIYILWTGGTIMISLWSVMRLL